MPACPCRFAPTAPPGYRDVQLVLRLGEEGAGPGWGLLAEVQLHLQCILDLKESDKGLVGPDGLSGHQRYTLSREGQEQRERYRQYTQSFRIQAAEGGEMGETGGPKATPAYVELIAGEGEGGGAGAERSDVRPAGGERGVEAEAEGAKEVDGIEVEREKGEAEAEKGGERPAGGARGVEAEAEGAKEGQAIEGESSDRQAPQR